MGSFDLFALDWYYYALGGGAILTVIALIVYFVMGARSPGAKLPAAVVCTITALVAGAGGGALFMTLFGYRPSNETGAEVDPGVFQEKMAGMKGGKGGMQGMPPGGPPGMGGKGFGGKGPGGKGGGALSSKAQLATLVSKLDQLTGKPLTINLTAEQKAVVRDALKGLADPEELKDDDAKERLDKVLEVLKGQRPTLEAAGYRWPGGGGGGFGGGAAPNPFKEEANGNALKNLDKRLGG